MSIHQYERKVTPIERFFARSPYAIVTLVARIRGEVSEKTLVSAVAKTQQRHPNLRVRIKEDQHHALWFTSEGAQEIPIEVRTRRSADDWIEVVQESSRVPFEFEKHPAIRFFLIQSPEVSELVILCHHILCDGLSLAYLARDLVALLGTPSSEVEILPDPVQVGLETFPNEVSLNGLVKYFIKRINRKWGEKPIYFDQEDYQALTKAYWDNFEHKLFSIELTEAQTTALVGRCKKEGVSVNTALAAAFVGAQTVVRGEKSVHPDIGIAASLRDRLNKPVGEVMGFFAGILTLKLKYNAKKEFWENARYFHQKVKPQFTSKNLFKDPLNWCYLDPAMIEAINFKKLGGLVPSESPRYQKLAEYSQADDVVLAVLKRDGLDTLDKVFMGTAVTNLTRMDFPETYGTLTLDRLIMKPGGGFPLVNVGLVLGAVTCAGKLSLVIEYTENSIGTTTMKKIKDAALGFLLNE